MHSVQFMLHDQWPQSLDPPFLLATRLALQHFLSLVQGQPVMVMTNDTTVVAQLRNRWRNAVKVLLQPHCSASALGWYPQYQHSAPAHSRQAEHHSKPLASPIPRPHLRVDPVTSSPSSMAAMGATPHGHVRHCQQRMPAHVRLSTSRPPGVLDQCLVLHMDGPSDLPVSSSSSKSASASKSHPVPGSSDSPAWLSQTWFPLLLKLLVNLPHQLPVTGTLLRPPSSRLFHQDPTSASSRVASIRFTPTQGIFIRRGTWNYLSTPPVNAVSM